MAIWGACWICTHGIGQCVQTVLIKCYYHKRHTSMESARLSKRLSSWRRYQAVSICRKWLMLLWRYSAIVVPVKSTRKSSDNCTLKAQSNRQVVEMEESVRCGKYEAPGKIKSQSVGGVTTKGDSGIRSAHRECFEISMSYPPNSSSRRTEQRDVESANESLWHALPLPCVSSADYWILSTPPTPTLRGLEIRVCIYAVVVIMYTYFVQ